MKIKISKINIKSFMVREKINVEHLKQMIESFRMDGQWDPIILRLGKNEKYDLISGHYRVYAAMKLGWDEIEATIKDISDEEAEFLSLKTNLLRLDMSAIEQGKILYGIMKKYNISGAKLAKKIHKNNDWVTKRVRLVLNLHNDVIKALEDKKINFAVALIIGSIKLIDQPILLEIIVNRKISSQSEAIHVKNGFLNSIIYTVGYQGKSFMDFLEILQNNNIKVVIDIRCSAKSEKKPKFNKDVLKRELERYKIKYKHYPEFGVPFNLQLPYKQGEFSTDCLQQWYKWHINNETEFDDFIKYLKNAGRTVLMCMEKTSKPSKGQKYSCHRDFLVKLILDYKTDDILFKFKNRQDL